MVIVERRRGTEVGRRAEMWPAWRRGYERWLGVWGKCRTVCLPALAIAVGMFLAYLLSDRWVIWQNVVLKYTEVGGQAEIVADVDFRILGWCDRVRTIAPWPVTAYYPEQNVYVRAKTEPHEVLSRSSKGHSRVRILLDKPLQRGIPHELTIGISCLLDSNGGTVLDAETAVVVKRFIP